VIFTVCRTSLKVHRGCIDEKFDKSDVKPTLLLAVLNKIETVTSRCCYGGTGSNYISE